MKKAILPHFFSDWGQRFLLTLQRLGAETGCIAGMILAAGSVAGSFFVPTKALGIFVSSIGCFLSGCIFTAFFAKSMKLAATVQAKNENLAKELDAKIKEVARLKSDAEQLRMERDRLNHQRIDINSVGPILKIGLAEVDMKIKDFKQVWCDDLEDHWLTAPKRSQYLGLLEKSFKATFGIDMKKLMFQEGPDFIRVWGFETENIGFRDLEENHWLLRQNQRFALKTRLANDQNPPTDPEESFVENGVQYTIDRTKIAEVSLDLNQLETNSKSQSEELAARINRLIGPEFTIVNAHIRDMTEKLLTMLLKPLEKQLLFIDTKPEGKGLPLDEFVKECNKRQSI